MAEYIDRNRLIKKFCSHCYFDVGEKNCAEDCYDMKIIKSLPIEDVQPVVHGRWVLNSDRIPVCSVCDGIALQKILLRFPTPEYYSKFVLSNYCPYCGAIIDGGDF